MDDDEERLLLARAVFGPESYSAAVLRTRIEEGAIRRRLPDGSDLEQAVLRRHMAECDAGKRHLSDTDTAALEGVPLPVRERIQALFVGPGRPPARMKDWTQRQWVRHAHALLPGLLEAEAVAFAGHARRALVDRACWLWDATGRGFAIYAERRSSDAMLMGHRSWIRPHLIEPACRETPLLIHVPHAGTNLPRDLVKHIVLDEAALDTERIRMTDHCTDELFVQTPSAATSVVNRLSRLGFDPERFEDPASEEMECEGMGAVDLRTSDRAPLRDAQFDSEDREAVLRSYDRPYHEVILRRVDEFIEDFGCCLILDCHSFPKAPLPYEDARRARPQICIGYSRGQEAQGLLSSIESLCAGQGLEVGHNTPFSGSFVPLPYIGDLRVRSVMIELRRDLYLDESSGRPGPGFERTRELARAIVECAERWVAEFIATV